MYTALGAILAAALAAATFAAGTTGANARPVPRTSTVAIVPPPSPSSPLPSSAARPKPDRATRLHRGIVTCEAAPFLSWPDHNGAPSGSAYPPARMGDSLEVIGDGTLANNGTTLYETTVDVLAPYGVGKHYYIPAECVNAG